MIFSVFFKISNAAELTVIDLTYGTKTIVKTPKDKAVRFKDFLIRCRVCFSEKLKTGSNVHVGFFEIWELLDFSNYPKLIFSSWISSDNPFGYKRYDFHLKGPTI